MKLGEELLGELITILLLESGFTIPKPMFGRVIVRAVELAGWLRASVSSCFKMVEDVWSSSSESSRISVCVFKTPSTVAITLSAIYKNVICLLYTSPSPRDS